MTATARIPRPRTPDQPASLIDQPTFILPASVTRPVRGRVYGRSSVPQPAEPAWCEVGPCGDEPAPEDRMHARNTPGVDEGDMLLSQYRKPFDERSLPARLHIEMRQHVFEVSPRILVGRFVGDVYDVMWLVFTVAEAADFAGMLVRVAEVVETPLPQGPPTRPVPFWLTTDCPSWCQITHRADDRYDDRVHASVGGDDDGVWGMPMPLVDSPVGDRPPRVEVQVNQHYRSLVAEAELCTDSAAGFVRLTPWELRVLAGHVMALVDLARGAR